MSSANPDLKRTDAAVWPLERPPIDFGRALAPPLTSLIGREHDIDLVVNLLMGSAHCVTLTGPGGVGKTRLALAVATELFPSLRHGVFCVPLAGVDAPGRLPDAIALALGVGERPESTPGEDVAAWLGDRELMLVLDNFEHLSSAAPWIQELLQRCPRLVCLVTSRSPLRISGEHVVQVAPLQLAPSSTGQTTTALDDLAASPAVQLFIQRARAADVRFAFSETTAHPIAEICRRLDGLPLAIELAAAQIPVLTPTSMLMRMDRRLHFLGGGPTDQPTRLQTMRDTIGWSYDLLSPAAQRLFRTLSIFIGGATMAACEAVAPPETIPAHQGSTAPPVGTDGLHIATLRELVDQQLVQRSDDPSGDSRFVMLQTVLAFGIEQIERTGERKDAVRRHAVYFVELAERLEPEFTGSRQREVLASVDLEMPNFRAAYSWLMDQGDSESAVRLTSALSQSWLVRGRASEGITWIESALSAMEPVNNATRAHALAALSSLFFVRGDYDQAIDCCHQVISIARHIDAEKDLGTALTNLGCAINHRGQTEEALGIWEDALVVQRRRNDRDGIATLQNNAGIANVARDNLDLARTQLSEAYRIRQEIGPPSGLASVSFNLSQLAVAAGDTPAIRPMLERSLELYRSVDDVRGVAWVYYGLGQHFFDSGDTAAALDAFLDGLILSEQADDSYVVCYCLEGLAFSCRAQGNAVLATKLHGSVDWLRRSAGASVYDYERAAREQELAAIRAKLTEIEFTSAWVTGELMQVSDVVAEVAKGIIPTELMATEKTLRYADPTPALSTRERDVLRHVVDGLSDREISEALFISRKTASNHVASILHKLDVPNRAAAVTFAHRHRLV